MPVTASRQRSTRQVTRRGSIPPVPRRRSEADVYSEIVRVWWSMYPSSERLDHVIQPFVIGPEFAHAVGEHSVADSERAIIACARIVSTERWQLRDAILLSRKLSFIEAFDPASAWWLPLYDQSGMGVHFWRLVTGTIELRSVGSRASYPSCTSGDSPREKRDVRRNLPGAWRRHSIVVDSEQQAG
jgi:hypothetical protein